MVDLRFHGPLLMDVNIAIDVAIHFKVEIDRSSCSALYEAGRPRDRSNHSQLHIRITKSPAKSK